MISYSCMLFLFLVTMVLLSEHRLGVNENKCIESRCGSHGPAIRFPFLIKGLQPDHCAYPDPGFHLYCSDKKETILELPNSVKLRVKKIDYKSQMIYTGDPQGCLPYQLLNLKLSASSPFKFLSDVGYNCIFLNCSWRRGPYTSIQCLSSPSYQVYWLSSQMTIDYSGFSDCTKIYDFNPFPNDFLYGNYDILRLSWSNPSCGSCAALAKYCRLKPNATLPSDTECYGNLKQFQWTSAKFLGTGTVLSLLVLAVIMVALYRVYSTNKYETEYQSRIKKFLDDYKAFMPTRYSYADIKRMTNQFKEELGRGAYGTVFKGKISDEILVAVKVLNSYKGNGEEFVNEVGTIGKIHHVNVVRLIGFCADGFRRALVYEYLPNDSLQIYISPADAKHNFLGWKRLQDITLGIAKGIEYLHQGCEQRILHFDIKPHNILLDHDFNPKISDFGLAKLCAKDQSVVSMTTARGTVGYIAPEIFSRNFGNVSYKSDVFSFGMLVLEMVGGRKIVDVKEGEDEQVHYPEWIYNILEEGEDLRLDIEEEEDARIAKKLAIVGLSCIQWNPVDRPSMNTVVQMLKGRGDNLSVPPNPFKSANPGRMKSRIQTEIHQKLEVISETEQS